MLFFCDKIKSDLRVLSRSFRNRNFNLLIILFSSISFLPQKEFYFSLTTLFLSTLFPQRKLLIVNYSLSFHSSSHRKTLICQLCKHLSLTFPTHTISSTRHYSFPFLVTKNILFRWLLLPPNFADHFDSNSLIPTIINYTLPFSYTEGILYSPQFYSLPPERISIHRSSLPFFFLSKNCLSTTYSRRHHHRLVKSRCKSLSPLN